MDEAERYRRGLEARRAVLGDAHVDRALARHGDLDAEFQDLVTRHAWGEIWTRPGLPRRTRSLLTLAMTLALNRAEEFRLHLRGAVRNGVGREEVKELLLQAAIYCGLPAANTGFRMAREVFEEMEREEAKGPPPP